MLTHCFFDDKLQRCNSASEYVRNIIAIIEVLQIRDNKANAFVT